MAEATVYCRVEKARLEFLIQRDGMQGAATFARRTLRLYRQAVLNKRCYAALPGNRRGFIISYLQMKSFARAVELEHRQAA